MMDYLYQLIR